MIDWGSLQTQDGSSITSLLEMFKLFLGIDPGDNTNDEELNRALNFAGDAMESYLDRVIAKRPVDEYFVHHFGTVVLHNYPVDTSAPLNVFVEGVQDNSYDSYLDRDKMCHLSRTGHRRDMPMDWRKYDNVTVTYTAGWDPIPSDLAYAICVTAAGYYNAEGTGNAPGGSSGAVKSVNIFDVGSLSYDVGSSSSGGGTVAQGSLGAIPEQAAQMATKYKRWVA